LGYSQELLENNLLRLRLSRNEKKAGIYICLADAVEDLDKLF
jgi:hypothetical protein